MDLKDESLRADLNSILTSLKSLLPKKKDIPFIQIQPRVTMTKLSDVHLEAKTVFPQCFLGAKVVVLRRVMDRLKLVQEYNFGKQKDTYKSFEQLLQKEMEPKPDGKITIDLAGAITASYMEKIEGGYEMRLTSKIRDIISSEAEILFERTAPNSVGSIGFSLKDIDPTNMKVITQYIHKVYPGCSLGTEIGFRPLSYPIVPEYSLSARYERPSFVVSSTVAKTGFQICLYKQFAPGLGIATVINEGHRGGPAILGFALQKQYANGSELKIFVDSQRCGGFTFQKDVVFPEHSGDDRVLRLVASTLIDRQRRVRLGFGFNLDF